MVIMTAKDGVTRQQIMNVMPAELRATVKLYLDGKIPSVVLERRRERGDPSVRREDRRRSSRGHRRDAVVEGTPRGPRVHPRGAAHAAVGLDRSLRDQDH